MGQRGLPVAQGGTTAQNGEIIIVTSLAFGSPLIGRMENKRLNKELKSSESRWQSVLEDTKDLTLFSEIQKF